MKKFIWYFITVISIIVFLWFSVSFIEVVTKNNEKNPDYNTYNVFVLMEGII